MIFLPDVLSELAFRWGWTGKGKSWRWLPHWPRSRRVVLIGALFQGRSAVGLEVSVLLVKSLHRYRELFVLETVEPRLGALSPSVSASRALGPQACTALPHGIVLKILSEVQAYEKLQPVSYLRCLRCHLGGSRIDFP